jgi:hypothetical protein
MSAPLMYAHSVAPDERSPWWSVVGMALLTAWSAAHAGVFALPTLATLLGRTYHAGWMPLGSSPGLYHLLASGRATGGRALLVFTGVAVDGLLVVWMVGASWRARRAARPAGWGLLAALVFSQGLLLAIGTLPAYFDPDPLGLRPAGTVWEALIHRAGVWTARRDGWIQLTGWLVSAGVVGVGVRRLGAGAGRKTG